MLGGRWPGLGADHPHGNDSAPRLLVSDCFGPDGGGQDAGIVLERHQSGVAEGEAFREGQLAMLDSLGFGHLSRVF